MDYCTPTDLQNRLTKAGYKFVADRNRDGTATPDEVAAYITTAIQYAGSILDDTMTTIDALANARAQANDNCTWLHDRAVDIAAWYAASQGGRGIPEAFVTAYQYSIEQLERKKGGERIPNYIYAPPPMSHHRSSRFPRIVNPRW